MYIIEVNKYNINTRFVSSYKIENYQDLIQ